MKPEYIQEATVKSSLSDLIYDDYIKYHVKHRVFSFREYQEMVLRDPDQVAELKKQMKRKVKKYV